VLINKTIDKTNFTLLLNVLLRSKHPDNADGWLLLSTDIVQSKSQFPS